MKYSFSLIVSLSALTSAQAQDVSFSKQIVPFVSKYCVRCHSSMKAKGDVNLETHAAILKSDVLVPRKPAESTFLQTMLGQGPKMPPKNAMQPTAAEIALVKAWIQQGAKDDAKGKAIAKAGNDPGNPRRGGERESELRERDDERREGERRRKGPERKLD